MLSVRILPLAKPWFKIERDRLLKGVQDGQ